MKFSKHDHFSDLDLKDSPDPGPHWATQADRSHGEASELAPCGRRPFDSFREVVICGGPLPSAAAMCAERVLRYTSYREVGPCQRHTNQWRRLRRC